MARKRATMREGPLAELFRKTEAAQRAQEAGGEPPEPPSADPRAEAALDKTVEHVPDFAREPEPERVAPEPPVSSAPAVELRRRLEHGLEVAGRCPRVPPTSPRSASSVSGERG